MGKFKIEGQLSWQAVVDTARDVIIALNDKDIPKHKRMNMAIDDLAEAIDDALSYGTGPFAEALESVDRLILRGIMRIILQFAFRNLKNEGKLSA